MLRTAKEIIGYDIEARDGQIGQISDLYFDDELWIVRYLIVDTGGWLSSGRKVLISPMSVSQPDWATQTLPVDLTKEQIENSPSIDLEQPVSRQLENKLHAHYGWSPYWTDPSQPAMQRPVPYVLGVPAPPLPISDSESAVTPSPDADAHHNSHLRSMDEVLGYNIEARDGSIGHVETFVVDDSNWSIMYLVVDTRNWLPGKKVLVALSWIERISWIDESVYVDLLQDTVRNSPEYRPNEPINRETESTLYDYYGRPVYW